jgi:ribosomal protein L2
MVAGNGADISKPFDFTLILNGANDTYTYFGHGIPGGTIKSGNTISLLHGQSITIMGLPKGVTYEVLEKDYSADGYTSSGTGATGSIVADATQTALFINTRTIGNLTISKTVQGKASDTLKQFNFNISLNGVADSHYAYIGNGVPNGTIKSGDKISLSHGQSITIIGLPASSTYIVTEDDYSGDFYTENSTVATGNIVADATQTALFINTKTVGNLTISKTVAGNAGDNEKKFDFTFILDGRGAFGTYHYTGNGVPDGIIKSGDTISLANGNSITIEGIPDGATYEVKEVDYTADGYTTISTGSTGSIVTDTTQTASFTNTRNISYTSSSNGNQTGNLTISKTVAGEGADTTKKFKFKVIFNGASGSYHYTGNGVPGGIIKSGDTISLAHGQNITITGLPIGASYKISEEKSSAQGYYEESTGSSGIITYGKDNIAVFTNTKLPDSVGGLTIKLEVTDQDVDLTKKVEFIVDFKDLTGAYPYTGASTGTISSGDSIFLAYGESITITGLPEGVQYTVTEVGYSKDGNTYTSTGSTGQINANDVQTALFMDNRDNTSSNNSNSNSNNNSSKPNKPEAPSNNHSVKSSSQKSSETQGHYKIVRGKGMPKTGDNNTSSFAKIGLFCFSIALVSLAFTDFALRKKCYRRKNQQ